MSGTETAAVVAGLAGGVGFVVLFSVVLSSSSSFPLSSLEPKIPQEQAIKMVEEDLMKHYNGSNGIGGIALDNKKYTPMTQIYSMNMSLPWFISIQTTHNSTQLQQ